MLFYYLISFFNSSLFVFGNIQPARFSPLCVKYALNLPPICFNWSFMLLVSPKTATALSVYSTKKISAFNCVSLWVVSWGTSKEIL
jgi:hypothetical protein